ncbi:MAG: lytic transglycosylase domain-containing protein [bacterium]|nr:lytic transglycosylase domain-containing protein [bacterium]MDD5756868.1 lytic transglycosylase domain-containing protein [bacterium]
MKLKWKTRLLICMVFALPLYHFTTLSLLYANGREYKVMLKNGNTFYGVLVEKSSDSYIFRVKGGELNFYQNEIKDYIPTGRTISARAQAKPAAKAKKKISPKNIVNFDELIAVFAKKHNLEPALIKAVIKAESDFDQYCVSHKGAKGLMQLMPKTAECLGVFDIYSPRQNIEGGTRYLAEQLRNFGDIKLALAAYNAGPDAVRKYNGIPPFRETKNYIIAVLTYWQYYANRPISIQKPLFIYTDDQGNIFLSDISKGPKYRKLQ